MDYKWKTPSGEIQHKAVVPTSGRSQILFEHHWARIVAHFGVERTLHTLGVGATMGRLGIDIMGPLPESDKANKDIIVIGDYWKK